MSYVTRSNYNFKDKCGPECDCYDKYYDDYTVKTVGCIIIDAFIFRDRDNDYTGLVQKLKSQITKKYIYSIIWLNYGNDEYNIEKKIDFLDENTYLTYKKNKYYEDKNDIINKDYEDKNNERYDENDESHDEEEDEEKEDDEENNDMNGDYDEENNNMNGDDDEYYDYYDNNDNDDDDDYNDGEDSCG